MIRVHTFCPCACTLVCLGSHEGHSLAPVAWACAWCGFVLLGLAVPIRPAAYRDRKRCYAVHEVLEATEVYDRARVVARSEVIKPSERSDER